ncbi:uncharacterized protein N7506_008458 [Penicillium brevicompactum]|uniref:uncharacterized protein n=1 Tax=Penicillium brevicompactum TaxID=5074 RepID=UPI0025418336|nr:uncharacterized protein N7506_008458 [Penicillium brevicompactum]KAJ5325356.1 hypothetical protein N7506_008458 [Penicillium brevicompactum]
MLLQLLQSLGVSLGDALLYLVMTSVLLLSIGFTIAMQLGNSYCTRRSLRNLQNLGSVSSNMEDQYNSEFDLPPGTAVDGPMQIKALYLHPVKSCGPIEVDRALLTKTGFMYDRCFALATENTEKDNAAASTWRFISQRTKPLMSLVKTELWVPRQEIDPTDKNVQSSGCLVMRFDDPDTPTWVTRLDAFCQTWNPFATPEVSFVVPLHIESYLTDKTKTDLKAFGIHSRNAMGLDFGGIPSVAAALPKLKRFLEIPEGQRLTLFKCTPDTLVRTDKNLAPLAHIGSPAVHGYTDQQPININSLTSVHAVSALLPAENQPMNALRFRANIWITNAPAFEEETWKRYRILPKSGVTLPRAAVAPTLSVVCRTSRCTMPNVNPDKGVFDTDIPLPGKKRGKPQPSTTLVEHRTIETGNKSALGYLGMHCVPEDSSLKAAEEQGLGLYVEVGDEIQVIDRGTHLYGSTGDDY